MDSETLCQICGGSHPTGACSVKETVHEDELSAHVGRLMDRLTYLADNSTPRTLTKQEARMEQLSQSMPNEKAKFLMTLRKIDTSIIPLKDIQAVLLEANPDTVTNKSVLDSLISKHISLRLISGEYDEAFKLFTQYVGKFPEHKMLAIRFYAECVGDSNCPKEEGERYRQVALTLGVTHEKLDGAAERTRQISEKSAAEKFDAAFYSFASTVIGVEKYYSKDAAGDLIQFAQIYVPAFDVEKALEKHAEVNKKMGTKPAELQMRGSQKRGERVSRVQKRQETMEGPPGKSPVPAIRELMSRGRNDEARRLLEATIDKRPRDTGILLIRFNLAMRELDLEGADRTLRRLENCRGLEPGLFERLRRQFEHRFGGSRGSPSRSTVLDDFGSRVPTDKLASEVTGWRRIKKNKPTEK